MVYSLAWPGNAWHGIWYGLAGMAWYMAKPGFAWHDIRYGIVDMAWYMVRPGLRASYFIYGTTWRAGHGTWYDLEGMSWFIVWLGGHGMVYSMAWRACRYMVRPSGHCIWYGLAHSQVEGLLPACSVHMYMYSSCSLWAAIVNRQIVNL